MFGGAKSGIGQVRSDPPTIGARATSEHDRNGINEAVVSRFDLPPTICEQFFNEQLESWSELIQAAIYTLISGQGRKPLSPMIMDVIINAALCGQSLRGKL